MIIIASNQFWIIDCHFSCVHFSSTVIFTKEGERKMKLKMKMNDNFCISEIRCSRYYLDNVWKHFLPNGFDF